MQWVCYIEIQGFYAAAAHEAGLASQESPVIVLHNGAVFDGCRQAFTSGLVLGAPVRQAMRDVPQAVRVEMAQIDTAQRARTWWDRCHAHTPYIEPCEHHQLFLALSAPSATRINEIRAEILQIHEQAAAYGFAAFVGVAASKLVARAAALTCKADWLLRRPGAPGRAIVPEQVLFVSPGEEARFLATLPVTLLPASSDVQRRLIRLGIRSIGEISRIAEGEWVRQLGPQGRQLALWSQGVDSEPVKPCYPPRTLEQRVAFATDSPARDQLERVVGRAALQLSRTLAAAGEGCQQASLTLELADGPPIQLVRVLPKLQQTLYPIQQALLLLLTEALRTAEAPGMRIAALRVELGVIGPMPWQQLDLWDDRNQIERQERLQQVLVLLHQRFPMRMVGLGAAQDVSWREQMLQFHDPYRWAAGAR